MSAEEQEKLQVQPIRVFRSSVVTRLEEEGGVGGGGDPMVVDHEQEEDEESYLPVDCMIHIFSFLRPTDLCHVVSLVCKGWRYVGQRSDSIWRVHYFRHFEPKTIQNWDRWLSQHQDSGDEEEGGGAFSGTWIEQFKERSILRQKWYHNKPHSVGHLDILQKELLKDRARDGTFSRDLYIVGQDSHRVEERRAGYSIDVSKRTQVDKMTIVGDKLVSVDSAQRIKIWNLRTNQMIQMIEGNGSEITDIAATKNHIYIASGQMLLVYDMQTGLMLNELRSKVRKTDLRELYGLNQSNNAANEPLLKLCLNRDETLLFAVTAGSVEVYDAQQHLFKCSLLLRRLVRRRRAAANALAMLDSDDEDDAPVQHNVMADDDVAENVLIDAQCGLVAVSKKSTAKIYNLESGVCIQTMDISDILKKQSLNPTAPVPQVILHKLSIVNELCMAVVLQLIDTTLNTSEYFLKYFNIMNGTFVANVGCKIKFRSPGAHHHNPPLFFVDSDKIVCINQHAMTSSVFNINHGGLLCSVPLNLSAHQALISSGLANESYLILGTTFGGIVVYNFGGSQFYWSDLSGGRSLTTE